MPLTNASLISTDWSLDNVETYGYEMQTSNFNEAASDCLNSQGLAHEDTHYCLAVREYSSAGERVYQRLYRHSQ